MMIFTYIELALVMLMSYIVGLVAGILIARVKE